MARPMKIVCTAFMLAVMATLCIGAGSASAVALCKENKNACPKGMTYPKDTVFALKNVKGGEIAFVGTKMNVTCNSSTITYKLGAESAAPLPGSLTAFTLTECEGCKTATVPFLPYSSEVKQVGGAWVLSYQNGGSGVSRVRFSECAFGVECTFSPGVTELSFTGGQPAKVTASKVSMILIAGNKEFCGEETIMGGTWEFAEATEPGQKGVANPPVWPQLQP